MNDIGRERIASALRRLADDLGAERLRASALRHENRELRAELERLQRIVGSQRAALESTLSHGEVVPELERIPPTPEHPDSAQGNGVTARH